MAKKRSSAYWKKRFEQIEQAQHQTGAQAYAEIEAQYRKAQRQIEQQINAWYGRFATNNGVTLQEARRMLSAKELAELKWDVQEYIRYGEQNAINGQWVKELENASARFHISRLEALKLQTQQSLEVMFGDQLDTLDQTMRDVYKSGYYRTAYEVQRGCGVGWDFATLDDTTISKVINKPWAADGANFSARVWNNRQKLVNELNQTLTQNIVLGQDPQKAIDAIAKKLNTSKANAGRLVMTEEAFFSSAAQKDCFNELDVEQFEIVATLDSHTSEICQDMDGKHFPMSQWEVGVTAPPFHVYCRTTTVPYFDDDFDLVGERAARGDDGKTYQVPANMTYKEWKEKFVDGGDKSGLNEVEPDDTIETELPPDVDDYNTPTAPQAVQISMGTLGDQTQLEQTHADAMKQIIENAPESVQKTWNNFVDRLNVEEAHSGGKAFCNFTKGITLDVDKVSQGEKAPTFDAQGNIQWVQAKKPYYTAFHEFGHNISSLMAKDETGSLFSDIADVYRSKKFTRTVMRQNGQTQIGYTLTEMMQHEGDEYFNGIFQQMKADAKAAGQKASSVRKIDAWRKLRDEIRALPIEECTDLSDMFDGVSNGSYLAHYGHTNQQKNYWKKVSLGTEGFAEMFSATVMNPESVNRIKHYFPKSYELFLEILEEKGVNVP